VRWRRRLRPFHSREDEAGIADEVSAPADGPHERLERAERLRTLARGMRVLDDDHRVPLVLHYDRGLPLREVAEILGIPEGTVKSRLSHARARLREWMETHSHG